MPDRTAFQNADANRRDEMAAAEHAYTRLLEHLHRLGPELENVPALASRMRGLASKRRAALQALERHARILVSEFAFIDGQRLNHADARLLNTFQVKPIESAAARYCWALLHASAASLAQIVSATLAEYQAFTALQSEIIETGEGPSEVIELVTAEHGHRKRADRLAYRVLALQRLHLVVRHVSGAQSQTTKELEREMVEATGAEDEAAQILRQIQLRRIAASRGGRGSSS